MYCEHCGKKINNDDRFCGSCGTPVKQITPSLQKDDNTGAPTPIQKNEAYSKIHPTLASDTSKEAQLTKANAEGLGMKWFKFLIYFGLFFSALIYVSQAIATFDGSQYDATMNLLYGSNESWGEIIYQMFPSLSIVDKAYGAILLIFAVLSIVMRMRLAKFKTKAASQYILFLLSLMVVSVIYSIIVSFIVKSADMSLVMMVILLVIRFFLEKRYFAKREHLFVN